MSSRPHYVYEVEKHFPTIIRVKGFTENGATKFVSNFFTDRKKIAQILQFKPSDSREKFPVHKCPILLSFLCLLVKENKIDLSDTKLTVGDLYLRMVRCLYRKFTHRKRIGFVESEFVQVMKSVGILALKTLLSNNPLLQRSEIIEIAGEFAFEYGFFAGDEDFRLCSDPTADISVTYAHRSLEEFFGSFGFLQALDHGKSVDDILGAGCKEPIFMVNPLVLRFCLWLLTTTEIFGSPMIVYDQLVAYAAQRIDYRMLNTETVERMYPAMNVREAVSSKDSLKLEFFKQVFEKCEQVHFLHVNVQGFNSRDEVKGIMGLISHSLLNKLSLLSISEASAPHALPDLNSNSFTVSIDCKNIDCYMEISKILQTRYDVLKRNPQMCATIYCKDCQDLKILVQKHMKKLHVFSSDLTQEEPQESLCIPSEFPFCPHFTHFMAYGYQISDSVPTAFMKAVKEGKFPNLKRIELYSCTMNDCEWPEVPEFSCDLQTLAMSDPSQMQEQLLKLTELRFWKYIEEPLHINCLIHVPLESLSVLTLNLDVTKPQCLNDVLKHGFLPNLSELFVSCAFCGLDTFLREFDPNHTVKLEKLTLLESVTSAEGLAILSEKLTAVPLRELHLSHSFGFTGNLSVLFIHSFPRLNTVILEDCELNATDLQSLARASVEGKLPQLRHLDISRNDEEISDLFTHSAQWNQLTTLRTSDVNVLNVDPECLTSLEELRVSWHDDITFSCVTRCWSGLKTIKLVCGADIPVVEDGVERGMFPDLTIVTGCCAFAYELDPLTLFKLFKANIVVM